MTMTISEYVRQPDIHKMIGLWRGKDMLSWEETISKLEDYMGEKITASHGTVSKAWKNADNKLKNSPSPLWRDYILDAVNHNAIADWRKKKMSWNEIASILTEELNRNISADHLSEVWTSGKGKDLKINNIAMKRVNTITLKIKPNKNIKDIIWNPLTHMMIGYWKNQERMTWDEIRTRFEKKYNVSVSCDHLEDCWLDGVKSGIKTITKFNVREYLMLPENFLRIARLKEEKTWNEIAGILSDETENNVSKDTLENCYRDGVKDKMIEKSLMVEWALSPDVFSKIYHWRYDDMRNWNFVSSQLVEMYKKPIYIDFLIEAVKRKNIMDMKKKREEIKLKKIEKRKEDYANRTNYKDFFSNTELYNEVRMWINNAGYSWKDVANRLERRMKIELNSERLRKAFYSE